MVLPSLYMCPYSTATASCGAGFFFVIGGNMNIRRKIMQTTQIISELVKCKNVSEDLMMLAWTMKSLEAKINLWIKGGEKTFILSKELIEAFLHTDIPMSMKASDFKYPFNTFVIEGEVPLYSTNNGTIDVQSILFTDSKIVYETGVTIASPDGKIHDKLAWDVSISALNNTGPGLGLDHMWLNLSNDENIEETYKTPSMTAAGRNAIQRSEAQHTINILFNTIMYINDETRDVKTTEFHKKRKMKNETGKKRHNKGYIYLRPPTSYKSLKTSAGEGRKIDTRFIVRGHYRNQVYGKRREQSRRIWIMPFWKGPEMSEMVSKTYKVK